MGGVALSKVSKLLRRVQNSSLPHGDRNPLNPTTHSLGSGYAGVTRGTPIPISGPVSEVVNFLADLFKQGYQYRSLNAYRSAISSVHDRVEGVAVGQHPLCTIIISMGQKNSWNKNFAHESTG